MTQQTQQKTAPLPEDAAYAADRHLAHRYCISRQTWWRWVRDGNAPQPVKLARNCTRWKMADVLAWEARQEGVA